MDFPKWYGPRFTLGGILGDILNNLAVRYTVLHVNIAEGCTGLKLFRRPSLQDVMGAGQHHPGYHPSQGLPLAVC